MNVKLIIFSGIMTALIGAMLGLAINYIGQRPERRKIALIGGSSLGFVIGAGYEAVRQNKDKDEDFARKDKWE
jgi:hypothetical protein